MTTAPDLRRYWTIDQLPKYQFDFTEAMTTANSLLRLGNGEVTIRLVIVDDNETTPTVSEPVTSDNEWVDLHV